MTNQEFEAKVAAMVAKTGATDYQVLLAWENVCIYSDFAEDDYSTDCLACFHASLEELLNSGDE